MIKRLWKVDKDENFPNGLEFAYQFLHSKNNKWIQVVRIDNQLHEGKPGTHIHTLNREKVEWENNLSKTYSCTFEFAEFKIYFV